MGIPLHSLHDAGIEIFRPTSGRIPWQFCGVDGMALVVAKAVSYEGHELSYLTPFARRPISSRMPHTLCRTWLIATLAVINYNIGFTDSSLVEDRLYGLTI